MLLFSTLLTLMFLKGPVKIYRAPGFGKKIGKSLHPLILSQQNRIFLQKSLHPLIKKSIHPFYISKKRPRCQWLCYLNSP